jgi:hypothetical protein
MVNTYTYQTQQQWGTVDRTIKQQFARSPADAYSARVYRIRAAQQLWNEAATTQGAAIKDAAK